MDEVDVCKCDNILFIILIDIPSNKKPIATCSNDISFESSKEGERITQQTVASNTCCKS